jgi:hypothetical protein
LLSPTPPTVIYFIAAPLARNSGRKRAVGSICWQKVAGIVGVAGKQALGVELELS